MGFISPVAVDSNGQPKATGSMQTLGKDDFLQLLVTKMRYQDPLSPMSDESFIAQLAQFATLEQMNNIATGIETSNKWDFMQMQSINNNMAAGLIGKEIRASYNGVYYDHVTEPRITYTTQDFATEITFTVRDASGAIVNTFKAQDIQPGTNDIVWDGTDIAGNRVDEGYYNIEATGTLGNGDEFSPSLILTGIVEAISYREGAAFLNVLGTQIPLGDVTWIGIPSELTSDTDDSNDNSDITTDDGSGDDNDDDGDGDGS